MRVPSTLAGVLFGLACISCGSGLDLNSRPFFDNGVNVIQINLIDGLTGEAITAEASVTVQVGQHSLAASRDSVDGSRYTVLGIPRGTFPIVITVPNYLSFERLHTFNGTGSLAGGTPRTYVFGNVVMFPMGAVNNDIFVRVFDIDDGAPIVGAQVNATIDFGSTIDDIVGDEVSDVLAPTSGLRPSTITVSTDSSGNATLPAASLIFGATYDINVYNARNAAGAYLVKQENMTVEVGQDLNEVVFFMGLPSGTAEAVSANNENDEVVANLQVTFPYPVAVCSDPASHSWTNFAGDTDADTVLTTPHPDTPVVTSTTNGGRTLVIDYATDVNDPDDELEVRFNNIRVKIINSSTCTRLEDIEIRGGSDVDNFITVRAP
ncbi:MAG: hypothetical protein R3C68_03605 [Myxococcota bacterium]